uniref:G protein regulated inducer of neurite outgrowth 1 n=1 Tax=Nothobranchius kuhntae TaxID=321403 RepID=A0A1A8HQ74_NOTKU
MGSLKDEKRGLRLKEDQQPSEKSENTGHQAGSESSAVGEGHPLHTSQESTTGEDHQPHLHENTRDRKPTSKNQEVSGADMETSHRSVSEADKDSTQTDVLPLTPHPAAQETTATQNQAIAPLKVQTDGDSERGSEGRREAETRNISVPVPSTPDPFDPLSPAPIGQHHMRTQVSLEVVQCHSAATSPMTPPEGGHSFFFPSIFGKSGGAAADTKDAELQVGQQAEFCSVATSPMTPKTPSTTAFPVLVGRETVQKEEMKSEEQIQSSHHESFTAMKCQEAKSEKTRSPSSDSSPGISTGCVGLRSEHFQGTCEDNDQQCKQQRMGSLDQDITILVTQHGNNEEEDEKKEESHLPSVDPEMVKMKEEGGGKSEGGKETPVHPQDTSNSTRPQKQSEEPEEANNSKTTESKGTGVEPTDVSGTKPPESPAPIGCHNIRTQVSLEVVQCQSVATSPMTPPEGDQAFHFPSSFGKCKVAVPETKDAELQVGRQVEFCSVATAPMTPRTPIATTFPEIKKESSIEKKILEEEEEEEDETQHVAERKKKVEKEGEDTNEGTNCEDTCEEPVQEVSWDEKGMTWEVYGAVVEVAVLGSAIQKHLEKQVLKQKQQSSIPAPEQSEAEQVESGKGRARKKGERDEKVSRRRRNPFRVMMENVQQPHCCSRAHTNE